MMWFFAMPLEALSAAVLVALLLDYWFGEPTPRWHPVVWMGRYLGWSGKLFAPAIDTRSNHPLIQFAAGALAWCLGAAFVACLAALLLAALMNAHGIVQVCLLGVLLKPMMAWRVLRDEVRDVELALQRSLPEGQRQVARLVSRDVKGLSPVQVRQAALSTLAENLNDSVVAPLFWFFVLGLPGAAVYRFANTADAMWGYRGEHGGRDWTWAGKWAARADDMLSWVPARVTGMLICMVFHGRGVFELPATARKTPSPNGGWPMGALALGMDVCLEKTGVYCLNMRGKLPDAGHVESALRSCANVVASIVVVCMAIVLWGMP